MTLFQKMISVLNKDEEKDIEMYSDSLWTDCQAAKSFFAESSINIKLKNIESEEVREEMKKRFNRVMVPVIIIKGKVFIGFDDNKDEIKKILRIQ